MYAIRELETHELPGNNRPSPSADEVLDWVRLVLDISLQRFEGSGGGRTASAWMEGYSAARVLRDRDAALVLCFAAPAPLLLGPEPVVARALCAWELGQDWSTHLGGTLGSPAMEMLQAIHRRRPGAFNEALYAALIAHRERYDDRECDGHTDGWIALIPLGLCCLASDVGIPIEVESPYIPRSLIEG